MLDIRYIREHLEEVKANTARRRVTLDFDELIALDDRRLAALQQVEVLRRERNEIAEKMKSATAEERPAFIERGKVVKQLISEGEAELEAVTPTCQAILLQVPNMTHPSVPDGATDEENPEIARFGEIPTFSFTPKPHTEIGKDRDLLDFERGTKVAGAKSYFIKGKLALLEQALVSWTLKELVAEGFTPMITPDLAKDEVLLGTGFNPRGPEAQIYSIEGTDTSLIATAEIPLGGYYKDEIIDEDQLPIKFVGVSHCFRREAGTYGRESYGLYRVHQFTKVEMFVFATPSQSEAIHEELRRLEERIFTKLGVPFRVVDICTGDLGGPAYRKYDLEAWMWGKGEGKGGWGEVTSASNCTDYQARRLNIRVRRKDGTLEFLHTLNGTAIALSRGLIAIMENFQQEDGSILVPEVLRPYTGFDRL
ncbi:serine--tRNA ligase [Patescibacteria group bacterium]|nr:serine--tRNA ligase [Patescibacteria group bacterium]